MYKLIQKAISTALIFCMLPISGLADTIHGNDDTYISALFETHASYSETNRAELPSNHPYFLPDKFFFGSDTPCMDPRKSESRENQAHSPDGKESEHIHLPVKSPAHWGDFLSTITGPLHHFFYACLDQLLRIFWESSNADPIDRTRDQKSYSDYFAQAFNQMATLINDIAEELHEYVIGALIITVLKIGVFTIAPYAGLGHIIAAYIAITCFYALFSSLLYGFDFMGYKFDGILSHASDLLNDLGINIRLDVSQKEIIESFMTKIGLDDSNPFAYFINADSISFVTTTLVSFFMMRYIPTEAGTKFATLVKGFCFVVFSKEILANLMYFFGRMVTRFFTYNASDKSIGYLFMRLFKLTKASTKALNLKKFNEYFVLIPEKHRITGTSYDLKRNTEVWLSLHNSAKVTQEPLKIYQAVCGTWYLTSERFYGYNHTADNSSLYQFCSQKYETSPSLLMALASELSFYLPLALLLTFTNTFLYLIYPKSPVKSLDGHQ